MFPSRVARRRRSRTRARCGRGLPRRCARTSRAGRSRPASPGRTACTGRRPGQPVGGELVVEESHVACLLGEIHQALALAQPLVDASRRSSTSLRWVISTTAPIAPRGRPLASRSATALATRSRGRSSIDDLQLHPRDGFPRAAARCRGCWPSGSSWPWRSTCTAPARGAHGPKGGPWPRCARSRGTPDPGRRPGRWGCC